MRCIPLTTVHLGRPFSLIGPKRRRLEWNCLPLETIDIIDYVVYNIYVETTYARATVTPEYGHPFAFSRSPYVKVYSSV